MSKLELAYWVRFFWIGSTLIHVSLEGYELWHRQWIIAVILVWALSASIAGWRYMHKWIEAYK